MASAIKPKRRQS